MKMRYLFGVLLAGAALSATMAPASSAETLKLATEAAYPPFNQITQDGKIAGFDIDIGLAACAKMGRECEFVQQDWDGIIAGLQTRRYDAIVSSMGITEERKKQLLFTEPYYRPAASFVGRADLKPDFTKPDLGGLSAGAVPGIYECYVKKAFPKASLTVYPNSDAMYLDLNSGRIDLAFNGLVAVETGFLKTPDGKSFATKGDAVRDPECLGEGAGIALRKDEGALKAAFDKAIDEMRADGTYKKINDKYFSFDIYN